MKLYLPITAGKLAQLHAKGLPIAEGCEIIPLTSVIPNKENSPIAKKKAKRDAEKEAEKTGGMKRIYVNKKAQQHGQA